MSRAGRAVVVLGLVLGGWMAFDGTRALGVGDYVTPAEGEYAGQLGPWAEGLRAVGLEPRSLPVKGAFVVWGLAWVGAALGFVRGVPWARRARRVLGVSTLWYAPFGTVIGVAVWALLGWPRGRRPGP